MQLIKKRNMLLIILEFKEPLYLNDVKLQLKDINYHKNYFINEKSSIYDSYLYMLKEGLTGVPIVDSDENFKGIITIKDLAKAFIDTKVEALNTSYDNLLKVFKC